MNRRLTPVAAVLALAAGCGTGGGAVPVQPNSDSAQTEYAVGSSSASATAPVVGGSVQLPRPGAAEELWLTRQGKLWATVRVQPPHPAAAAALLRALRNGPVAAERAFGVATAVPRGTAVLGIEISHGIVTPDLSSRFAAGGTPASEHLRLAQLVFTLTQFPNVRGVRLKIDGKPVSVFSSDGLVLPKGPMTRLTFRDELPPIAITSPAIGGVVSPRTTIAGVTTVPGADVRFRLLDAAGHSLMQGDSSSSCSAPCMGSFSVPIDQLETPRWAPGKLVVVTRGGGIAATIDIPVLLHPTYDVLSPAQGGTLTSPAVIRFGSNLPHGGPIQVSLYDSHFQLLARRTVTGLCPLLGYCPSNASMYRTLRLGFQTAGVSRGYLGFRPLPGSGGDDHDILEVPVTLNGG